MAVAEQSHRPTRYLTCADTAKLIRKALAEAFPSVRFSVRSKTYAGGASINVGYTDGPLKADVERVAFAFQGGTFDGMTDYKGGKVHAFASDPDQPIHFGADFVFVDQTISGQHAAAARAALEALTPNELNRLEAKLRIGEFATPFPMDRGDWAYRRAVEVATLPACPPNAAPTAESVVLLRTY